MYGLPDGIEWTSLLGKELLQICIGLHQISLRFSGDLSVNIECRFEHLPQMDSGCAASDLAGRARSLMSLLGSHITGVTVEDKKTMVLSFSNDEGLRVHDSNESHESFQILGPGIDVIV